MSILRYSNERKIFDTRLFRNASGVLAIDSPDNRQTSTDWSPRIGLEYQPADNVLAYASVSRGFKSGGFNGRATTRRAASCPSIPKASGPTKPACSLTCSTGICA